MTFISERSLPNEFPHSEWSTFILQDAYTHYTDPLQTARPLSQPLERPHKETQLETLVGGIEDQMAIVMTSDLVESISNAWQGFKWACSIVYASLTMLTLGFISLFAYPSLTCVVSPIIALVLWLTPCFLYPFSDTLATYQSIILLLCDLAWDGLVYGIDTFVRHRYRTTS